MCVINPHIIRVCSKWETALTWLAAGNYRMCAVAGECLFKREAILVGSALWCGFFFSRNCLLGYQRMRPSRNMYGVPFCSLLFSSKLVSKA